ncbi:MAG: oligosaccharide flippase family protein, partial [Candidatus Omnitrophica bacterium]|nr:oligosaccharide flippase family protein [Candidatus Omnitrophota bacterium]
MNQILKNVFSNYFANFLQLALGVLVVPFLIRKLGQGSFGIVVLVESIICFFEVLATSVRIALSRYVTFSLSQERHEAFLEYLSSGRYLLFFSAALIFLLGSILSLNFQHVFQVPSDMVFQSKLLFFIVVFSFVITVPNIIYWSVLYAKQRFDLINLAFSSGIILRAVFIFTLFSVLPSPYVCLITYGFIYLSMKFMENYMVYRWHKNLVPDLKPSLAYFKPHCVREILSFSLYSSINSLAYLAYENTAIVLVNIFYGPAINAVYAVSLKIPTVIKNFFARATWTLNPTVTDLMARNDDAEIKRLFFVYSKAIAIAVIPLCLFIFFMAHQIIGLWIGAGFETAASLLTIHILPLMVILPLEAVGCITNAHAKVKVPSQVSMAVALCNVGTGILLAKVFSLGLYGFALSAAFFTMLYSAVFMPYYSCRLAKISFKQYIMRSLVQPFALAALIVGAYLGAIGLLGLR